MNAIRQELQEWVQGPVATRKMASIKRQLESYKQAEALRIAIAVSSSPASVPPPPPEPLPPPAFEPEENDDEFEADFGTAADASSVYSEYENDFAILDDDLSTAAPSDTSVLFFIIAERISRHRMTSRELHEEALRRHSAHIVAANEETRRRMWVAEDRWSTTSQPGGNRGFIREDYQMRPATAVSEDLDHHHEFV